jgi:hypothetical protein
MFLRRCCHRALPEVQLALARQNQSRRPEQVEGIFHAPVPLASFIHLTCWPCSTAKIRTLADMGGDDEEGDGDEEKQDLFAGGEKS